MLRFSQGRKNNKQRLCLHRAACVRKGSVLGSCPVLSTTSKASLQGRMVLVVAGGEEALFPLHCTNVVISLVAAVSPGDVLVPSPACSEHFGMRRAVPEEGRVCPGAGPPQNAELPARVLARVCWSSARQVNASHHFLLEKEKKN